MPDGTRRFTDREVALILRTAADLDRSTEPGVRGGLSLEDLREIGREVGISAVAIDRAAEALDGRRDRGSLARGAPLVRRAVHAVPGELEGSAIGSLVRLVDERAETTGGVSEALGSVRWTGADRFHSMQVSITPGRGETTIQVVEKSVPRLWRFVHLLPVAWGGILAGGVVGGMSSPSAAAVAGAIGLGAASGATAGRLVWNWLSGRSADRVERLAADLTREAHAALARSGGAEGIGG